MITDALTAAYTRAARPELAKRPVSTSPEPLSAYVSLPRHLWPAAHDQVLRAKVRIETQRTVEGARTLNLRTTEVGAVILCSVDDAITRCDGHEKTA